MLPRKIFKNAHALMAILVLFEYFSSKFCLNFFTLILSALPNVMHFVRTFSICVLLAKGLLLSKRLKIMEKLYTSKTFLIKAGGRRHTPHPAPLDPLLAISYKNHQTINQSIYSMTQKRRGKR